MKSQDTEPLSFPIGGKDYVIPPVGIDAGVKLAEYLDMNTAALKKAKLKQDELFALAMGDVWDQMRADNVPLNLAWRAGLASVGYFRMLLTTQDVAVALATAETLWESNADPESLAATMAAKLQQQTTKSSPASKRSRSSAGASKTRARASTSGTRSPSTTKRPARSRK